MVRPSDGPNSFHWSLRLKMFMRSEVASAVEKSFLLLDLKKQIQVNMHSYARRQILCCHLDKTAAFQ